MLSRASVCSSASTPPSQPASHSDKRPKRNGAQSNQPATNTYTFTSRGSHGSLRPFRVWSSRSVQHLPVISSLVVCFCHSLMKRKQGRPNTMQIKSESAFCYAVPKVQEEKKNFKFHTRSLYPSTVSIICTGGFSQTDSESVLLDVSHCLYLLCYAPSHTTTPSDTYTYCFSARGYSP